MLGAVVAVAALAAAGCGAGALVGPVTLSASPHYGGQTATWTYTATVAQSGEQISPVFLTGPAGTVFPSNPNDYTLTDSGTGSQTALAVNPEGNGVTVLVGCGAGIVGASFPDCPAINDQLTLTVSGVRNPPAGQYAGSDFTVYWEACDGPMSPPQLQGGAPPHTAGLPPDCALPTPNGLTFSNPVPPISYGGLLAAGNGQGSAPISSPEASVGSFVFDVLQAEGGVPPYTWSLVSGTLPPGLSLYASGAILGVPTTAGSYTFTVRVTDDQVTHYDEEITFVIK